MSSREVGDRIGAILDATSEQVNFLGWGKYVGNEIPEHPPPGTGCTTWEEVDQLMEEAGLKPKLEEEGNWPLRLANPKLELDNGDIVWGQECWWGSEEEVRRQFGNRKIVEVSISSAREKAYAPE